MQQPSERIKEKIDVVDFIKNYVELKPAGRNWKGRCPFHNERTPSFIVSKDRQIWHCFGCGKGGDVFKFLMEYENLEFREALKILAEKAGIELRSVSPEEYRQFGVLYDINSAAKDFYLENFKKFPVAHDYLIKRGLKKETMEEFEIGFAPNEFDATTAYLLKKGFKVDDVVRAGISFKSEKGRVGDRFRGRIMFPIHDHSGKVVGFSGRVLPELESADTGKYINSPETQIYNKSRILYGFWKSKKLIRESKTALLVEGQMDFLMVYQSGVKNVIATSGTALTPEHLKVLRPIANTVIMSFDNDPAGALAAERGIDLLGEHDFNVAILHLGKYKDPADAAYDNSSFIGQAMLKAKSVMNFYFERYLSGDSAREKKNIRAVLSKIKKLYSPIEKSNWLRELSHLTSLSERDLRDEMEGLNVELLQYGRSPLNAQNGTGENIERDHLLCERILSLVSLNKDFVDVVDSYIEYMPANYAKAYKALFNNEASDEQANKIINFISLGSGLEWPSELEKQEVELNKLLGELQIERLKKDQKKAQRLIMLAEASGDEEGLVEIMRKFDDISKKMQNIKHKKHGKK